MLIAQQQPPTFTVWMNAPSGMFNECVIVAGVSVCVCVRGCVHERDWRDA